jgi:hypothetical protein
VYLSFLSVVIIRMDVDRPAFFVYDSWAYGESLEYIIAQQEEKIEKMILMKMGGGSYFIIGQDKVHSSELIVALLQLVLLSLLVIFFPVSPVWSLFFLLATGPGPAVLIVVINTFLEPLVVEFWVAKRGVFGRVLYTAIAGIVACFCLAVLTVGFIHEWQKGVYLDVCFGFFLSLPQ